jgi:hypothetical protein
VDYLVVQNLQQQAVYLEIQLQQPHKAEVSSVNNHNNLPEVAASSVNQHRLPELVFLVLPKQLHQQEEGSLVNKNQQVASLALLGNNQPHRAAASLVNQHPVALWYQERLLLVDLCQIIMPINSRLIQCNKWLLST